MANNDLNDLKHQTNNLVEIALENANKREAAQQKDEEHSGIVDQANQKIDSLKTGAADQVNALKDKAASLKDQVTEEAQHLKDQASETIDQNADKLTDLKAQALEKIESLKTILHEDYLPEAIFERNFYLESGKVISRIWVEKTGVSLNNKNNWEAIFDFFNETMSQFEYFFYENEDYIKDLTINT